jgi:TRAP-type mannitol/chloroaromatic compound transport system permease small subunit
MGASAFGLPTQENRHAEAAGQHARLHADRVHGHVGGTAMKLLLGAFGVVQGVMAALFAVASLLLIVVAVRGAWDAVSAGGLDAPAGQAIIEAIGLLAAAVVALQIAQTIAEEEVIRGVHVSAPTRVRRFLSRFLVVLVVALAIEGLVASFKAIHEDISLLVHASLLLGATGLLLAGWGVFIRLNVFAEELEPEAMQQAKEEDQKLE